MFNKKIWLIIFACVLLIILVFSLYLISNNNKIGQTSNIINKEKSIKVKKSKLPKDCKVSKFNDYTDKELFCLAKSGKWQTDDISLLSIKNEHNISVAHILAIKNKKWNTDNYSVLSLKDNAGFSVAHMLALNNKKWNTENIEILKIANNTGYTVAHIIAKRDKKLNTSDKNILNLTDDYEVPVYSFIKG